MLGEGLQGHRTAPPRLISFTLSWRSAVLGNFEPPTVVEPTIRECNLFSTPSV